MTLKYSLWYRKRSYSTNYAIHRVLWHSLYLSPNLRLIHLLKAVFNMFATDVLSKSQRWHPCERIGNGCISTILIRIFVPAYTSKFAYYSIHTSIEFSRPCLYSWFTPSMHIHSNTQMSYLPFKWNLPSKSTFGLLPFDLQLPVKVLPHSFCY